MLSPGEAESAEIYMSHLKLLLLNLASLSVICLITPALAAGQWWINGAEFSGEETLSEQLKSGTKWVLQSELTGGTRIDILAADFTLFKPFIYGNTSYLASNGSALEAIVTEPGGCRIEPSIPLFGLHGLFGAERGKVFIAIKPKEGTKLAEIEVTGCAGEGLYNLTGEARCEVLEPSVEEASKICAFGPSSGSTLKFGAKPATLTAEQEFSLSGTNKGDKWSAK